MEWQWQHCRHSSSFAARNWICRLLATLLTEWPLGLRFMKIPSSFKLNRISYMDTLSLCYVLLSCNMYNKTNNANCMLLSPSISPSCLILLPAIVSSFSTQPTGSTALIAHRHVCYCVLGFIPIRCLSSSLVDCSMQRVGPCLAFIRAAPPCCAPGLCCCRHCSQTAPCPAAGIGRGRGRGQGTLAVI
jgi:hypothetical protein